MLEVLTALPESYAESVVLVPSRRKLHCDLDRDHPMKRQISHSVRTLFRIRSKNEPRALSRMNYDQAVSRAQALSVPSRVVAVGINLLGEGRLQSSAGFASKSVAHLQIRTARIARSKSGCSITQPCRSGHRSNSFSQHCAATSARAAGKPSLCIKLTRCGSVITSVAVSFAPSICRVYVC
jgi:hypothetical protein